MICCCVGSTTLHDHEIQLRIVAPDRPIGKMEYPGVGPQDVGVRDKLLSAYHNGPLGGHLGVDKTVRRVLKDWYWPGVYADVDA